MSSHPLSHALAALLASALERKYENTYARAQELFKMSQQSDFPDPRLGKTVGLLVNDFLGMCTFNQGFIVSNLSLDAFRKNTFTLVSRAFACLHVTEAQKLLGLGQKEVLASKLNGQLHTILAELPSFSEVANNNHWQFDATSGMLRPSNASLPPLVATKPGM